MTIKISQLANLSVFTDNTYLLGVNTAGTFSTIKSTGVVLKNYVLAEVSTDVSNLYAKTSELTGNIATLTETINIHTGNIALLTSQANVTYNDITNIQNDIVEIFLSQGNISTIVGGVQSNVNIHSNLIANLQSVNSTINSNISVIQGNISDINSSVFGQNLAITALTGRVTSSENDIILINSDIGNLYANAITQGAAISSLGNIVGVESNIAIMQSNIFIHTASIDALFNLSNIAEITANALSSTVDGLTSNVNANTSSIDNLWANAITQHTQILNNTLNVSSLDNTVSTHGNLISIAQTNISDLQTVTATQTSILSNTVSYGTATFANATPSSSISAGTKGDIKYDATYIYFCVSTGNWIRALRGSEW